MQVGGKPADSQVSRLNNEVVIRSGPVSAALAALDSKGAVAPLDPGGNVRLQPGAKIRLNAKGFKPGTAVNVWLFSTPIHIGALKADSTGSVRGEVFIPKNVESGNHRIAIEAVLPDGEKATVALGVQVGDYKKESNIATWLIVTPIVLAVMAALFLPAVRRRRFVKP